MLRSRGIGEHGASRVEVGRMRRRHLRGVMAIERQVYARPWSPNLFVAEMTEPNNRCYLVARVDKTVVGYGGLICYGDEAHVTNIAVDPQRHRLGIGTRLLHELVIAGDRDGGPRRLTRGAGDELGGPAPVRPVRLPAGGHPAELLPGAARGRADHVDRRHPNAALREPAGGDRLVDAGSGALRRDHARHRDVVRRDRRRGGGGRVRAAREPDRIAGAPARAVRRGRARGRGAGARGGVEPAARRGVWRSRASGSARSTRWR